MCTLVLPGLAAGCGSRSPVAHTPDAEVVPIMGAARLSSAQLTAWFERRHPQPPGRYAAAVPVQLLAQYFIEEGAAEGVAGDVAFVQGIVETAWFRFTGLVPASANNFGGIGAAEAASSPAVFPDARTGVRAQIQHLRAYADPGAVACAAPPLRHPCADPRFDFVEPKGRAPAWNDLGNGKWAAITTYGRSILRLYKEALAFSDGR